MTRDGGLATLIAVGAPAGGGLTRPEVLALVALVVIGGLDPLTHVVGNGLDTLLRSPAQLRRLRDEPDLWATAVDELLRWESPIPFTARVPTVEVTIGGRRIGAGETVVALLAAGNRDPAVFLEPETLDLARSPNPLLGFGAGVHVCLAALLARRIAGIALAVVLQRFPRLTAVDDEPAWLPGRVPRGLSRLPLRAGERAA
jgi:cytochrome P450